MTLERKEINFYENVHYSDVQLIGSHFCALLNFILQTRKKTIKKYQLIKET